MLAFDESIRHVFAQPCYLLMERSLVAGEAFKIQLWTQLACQLKMECVAAGHLRLHSEQRQKLQDILTCIRYSTELSQAGDHLLPMPKWRLNR